jgi:hypothetical protein
MGQVRHHVSVGPTDFPGFGSFTPGSSMGFRNTQVPANSSDGLMDSRYRNWVLDVPSSGFLLISSSRVATAATTYRLLADRVYDCNRNWTALAGKTIPVDQ